MLGSLLAILILGSYTRHTTLVGVISGARQETVTAAVSAGVLHAGQDLRIEVQVPGKVSEAGRARIISITASAGPGRYLYRIHLEIPGVCRRETGGRFLVRIPNERRHLYEWIWPCLFN